MNEDHQARAPLILNPNEIALLHELTHAALRGHSPVAWPASLRHQMETVRNFARGAVKRPKPALQAELLEYFLTFPEYFLRFPDPKVSKAFLVLEECLAGWRRRYDRMVLDVLLPASTPKIVAEAVELLGGRYLAIRRSIRPDRIVISVVNVRRRRNEPTSLYFFERARTTYGHLLKSAGVVIRTQGVVYFLGRVRHSSDMRLITVREQSRATRGARSVLTGLLLATSVDRAVFVAGMLLQPVPARGQMADLIGIFEETAVPARAATWVAGFKQSAADCVPLTLEAGEI